MAILVRYCWDARAVTGSCGIVRVTAACASNPFLNWGHVCLQQPLCCVQAPSALVTHRLVPVAVWTPATPAGYGTCLRDTEQVFSEADPAEAVYAWGLHAPSSTWDAGMYAENVAVATISLQCHSLIGCPSTT